MHETIREFIEADLVLEREITADEPLLLSGMIDSLGVMRIVAFLEASFGIKIPASDLKISNFGTLNAIAAYVAKRTAA
ncbi:acyl carrier protein [Tropicimonas sediminicola]|uniref:Acyl carrier protein n=1 Tax=Tropicimonas sediminicola TaxID=1031541 RepID=A0A239L938_9RHOB|nr:acyl carrier protein [Tropicimonas sediminicola]SNT26981.1 Acyl carrier protein [Tropicimonas sediminicola]